MNIEELENKIKELQEEINKLKEEKKPVKRWRANKNEDYFITDNGGEISCITDTFHRIDTYRYNAGNYFKTEQEAENYKEKLLIYQELKDLATELNNGEKIDWDNNNQHKRYIFFDRYDNKIKSSGLYSNQELGQIYCLDENFLDIAKDRIGEERLKKLFEEE